MAPTRSSQQQQIISVGIIGKGIALYDFTAKDSVELSIEEEDVINLLGKDKNGWYFGELNGRIGLLPDTYIKLLNSTSSNEDSDEKRLSNSSIDTSAKKQQQERPLSTISTATSSTANCIIVPMAAAPKRKRWMDTNAETAKSLSKAQVNRQEIIFELIETERDYVHDLETIIKIYMAKVKASNLISAKDVAVIFSNVEQLLPINAELLHELEARSKDDGSVIRKVGDIFLKLSDYLKIYTMYCSNHPYAVMKLQSIKNNSFHKLLQKCVALPECRNLELGSFLIKPVQRICKYPLLIREILKNTCDEGETDNDKNDIQSALIKIEAVVAIVNEAARRTESVFKIINLQSKLSTKVQLVAPSRELIKEGTLQEIEDEKKKKKRPLMLYIFNDLLLICKQAFMSESKINLVASYALNQSISVSNLKEEQDADCFYFQIYHEETPKKKKVESGGVKWIFEVESAAVRDSWVGIIQDALINYQKQLKSGDVQSVLLDAAAKGKQQKEKQQSKADGENLSNLRKSFALLRTNSNNAIVPMDESASSLSKEISSVDDNSNHNTITNENVQASAAVATVEERNLLHAKESYTNVNALKSSLQQQSTNNSSSAQNVVSKPAKDIEIIDVFRQTGSKREYVYVLKVIKSDDFESIIFVTYDDFFDFHLQLLSTFPEESGTKLSSQRIIPDLPPQMMVVTEAVARERLVSLESYLKKILSLNVKISKSYLVTNFVKKDGRRVIEILGNSKGSSLKKPPKISI